MTPEKIYRWKTDEVTQHIFKLMKEAEELITQEVLSYGPGMDDLKDNFLYAKGKLDGIRMFLEAELGDESYEQENV